MTANYFLQRSENTAIIWQNQSFSYAQLLDEIAKFCEIIPIGSKIALCMENRPEWIYAIYAAWQQQSVPVIFDCSDDETTIIDILLESEPEIIFHSAGYQSKIDTAIQNLAKKPERINVDELIYPENGGYLECINPVNRERTALIAYTSGTAARPKGVRLTFRNLETNIQAILGLGNLATEKDAVLVLLPLYHIFPLLWTILLPLYKGASCVFSPSLEAHDIQETLQTHYVSVIVGVPLLYTKLREVIFNRLEKITFGKLSFQIAGLFHHRFISKALFRRIHRAFGGNIRYLICGGAAIPSQVERDFRTLGFRLHTGYGLTETGPMVTFNPPGKIKIGSAGLPINGCEIKTINGEIVVRGDNVTPGYHRDESLTGQTLQKGWLFTGDLGQIDQDGYLWITGRKNEAIVLSNGKKIQPAIIEQKVLQMSDRISEIAVFERQNRLHALVLPNRKEPSLQEQAETEDHIRRHVIDRYNSSVPLFKKIAHVQCIDHELPKTALGKLKRYALDELMQTHPKRLVHHRVPDWPGYLILKKFLHSLRGKEISPDDHLLFDLGLDSLDMLQLQSFLESSFGIESISASQLSALTVYELAGIAHRTGSTAAITEPNWRDILQSFDGIPLPQRWLTHRLIIMTARLLFSVFYRMRVSGTDHIPDGPVIYAANHQTYLDPLFIFCKVNYRIFRTVFFTGKESYFRNRLIRFLASTNQIIIVKSGEALRQSLREMTTALNKGKSILLFPEGSRSADGALNEFQKTFAILSRELEVPVVPVAVHGAIQAYPHGSRYPRLFKEIRIRFLEPVYPVAYDNDGLRNTVFRKIEAELSR